MSTTGTRHTCTPDGKALPFGRKAPKGQCPRCDELHAGAAPRDLGWTPRRNEDAERSADLRAHFGSARHQSGGCGLVCTYGQW